jgi:hypothetical protein
MAGSTGCDSGGVVLRRAPGRAPAVRAVESEAVVKHYLLFYDVGEDYVQELLRDLVRPIGLEPITSGSGGMRKAD